MRKTKPNSMFNYIVRLERILSFVQTLHMQHAKPVILYVDDDEEDRFLLSDALTMAAPEYEIKAIESGVAALQFLEASKNNPPCLIVVDLNMPGMNGRELIAAIRKREEFNTFPLIAFTTSSSLLDKAECAKYGVKMVTKPLTFTDLKETVKQLASYCNTTV
jgi:CheY-like chemotaxis protein